MKTSIKSIVVIIITLIVSHAFSVEGKVDTSQQNKLAYRLHNQVINDPFLWLEDLKSERTNQWANSQNAETEKRLSPSEVSATADNILQYSNFQTYRSFSRIENQLFYLKGWSGTTTASLFVENTQTKKVKRLAGPDITKQSKEGAQTDLISQFWPSHDGRFVVILQTKTGERWGEFQILDVASGQVLKHIDEGAFAGLSQVSWSHIDDRLLLTLFDKSSQDGPQNAKIVDISLDSGKSQIVYTAKDYLKSIGSNEIEQAQQLVLSPVFLSKDHRFVVHVRLGSALTNKILLLDLNRAEKAPVALFQSSDANRVFLGSNNNSLWFYSDENAENGQVVKVDLKQPNQNTVVIPERNQAISANSSVGGNAIGMFGQTIALTYLDGGRYVVRGFNLKGKQKFEFNIPDSGSIWGGFNGPVNQDRFYFGFLGVGEPSSIYEVNGQGKRTLVKSPELPFEMKITARRVYVETAPGVKVPVLIAHRQGLDLSLPKPTILYAYGGFGWVSFMWYQPHLMEWFNRDGIYVIAGIRGGGEYGSNWHQAGIGHNRQNAINDYIATSQWLIEQGITKSNLLIANGGSLSGALVGAAILQKPELYGLALIDFPMIDMVRYNHFGHAKYWQSEIGDPSVKADFENLMAYSPYHNLLRGKCPPPTLVRTGQYDKTTTPMHGFKFVAASHRNKCASKVMLDVMEGAGHNFGATPEQISHSHAMSLTFIRSRLSPNL